MDGVHVVPGIVEERHGGGKEWKRVNGTDDALLILGWSETDRSETETQHVTGKISYIRWRCHYCFWLCSSLFLISPNY